MDKCLVLECPHCKEYFIVMKKELNCCIFRHAMLKSGGNINPHASKCELEVYLKNGQIYGCGKPFRVIKLENGTFSAEICDYI